MLHGWKGMRDGDLLPAPSAEEEVMLPTTPIEASDETPTPDLPGPQPLREVPPSPDLPT